jgi:hypothetical protein
MTRQSLGLKALLLVVLFQPETSAFGGYSQCASPAATSRLFTDLRKNNGSLDYKTELRIRNPTIGRHNNPFARRGQTQLSLAALPPPTLIGTIANFYKTYPYIAAFLTCGTKATIADIIAQKKFDPAPATATPRNEEESDNVPVMSSSAATSASTSATQNAVPLFIEEDEEDTRVRTNKYRTFAFLLYGGFYQGCIYEFMYNHVFPAVFGTATDVPTVAAKVIFDLCLFSPLISLPVAYLAKAVIFRYGVMEAMSR